MISASGRMSESSGVEMRFFVVGVRGQVMIITVQRGRPLRKGVRSRRVCVSVSCPGVGLRSRRRTDIPRARQIVATLFPTYC